MNAYIVVHGVELTAVRARDEKHLMTFFRGEDSVRYGVLRPEVASAMQIPEKEGYYRDVVFNWVMGPTNLLGELKTTTQSSN